MNYVFEIELPDKNLIAAFRTSRDDLTKTIDDSRVRIFVTEEQYNAGYASLDPAVVTAGIDAANDELSDTTKMGKQWRAVLKALIKVINIRLPAGQKITAAEMKQAIKAEL